MIKCDALAQNERDEHSATNGTRRSYNSDDTPRSRLPVMTDSEINPDSRLRLFEELILPHLDAAHNLARWLTRNEQDACDVVQEASMRAFRFFAGYKGGDGKYWLLEIVSNTSFTWLRREKRNLQAVPFDDRSHGSVPEASQEDARGAAAALSALLNYIDT